MPHRWRSVFFAILVAATLLAGVFRSAPGLIANAVRAARFHDLSVTRRREELFGRYFMSLRSIRDRLPESASVAIVMNDLSDREAGIFANTYLYPRQSLLYWGFASWEKHEFEGAVRERPRPDVIIWFHDEVTPEARLMTPDAIRRELEAR